MSVMIIVVAIPIHAHKKNKKYRPTQSPIMAEKIGALNEPPQSHCNDLNLY